VATIAFASAKGSPGVTTAVAALAATWAVGRELVVAELDPSGGDLAVRCDLAVEPGLITLAAAGRRELGSGTLLAHTQALPLTTGESGPTRRVLVGPVSADQASASLAALRGALGPALAALDADVLVDCGRLDPGSPAYDVATGADLLVMVARPVVAEVHHLAARVGALKAGALALLLVGDRPYPVSEVATTVGASPLGTLPVDTRAAAALNDGHPSAMRVLRRSHLLRDAGALAEVLAGWLAPDAGSPLATSAPHAATAPAPVPPSRPPASQPASQPQPPQQPQPPPQPYPPEPAPPPAPAAPPSYPPEPSAYPTELPGYPAAPPSYPPGPPPPHPTEPNGARRVGRKAPKHFRRDDVEESWR
jgi:hypothetical protein